MTPDTTTRLRTALATVVEDWDNALEPLPVVSAGGKSSGPGSRPPLPTGSLSVRAELWEFLASWRRYTTEWFEDDPQTWDVPILARWFSSHAEDLAADEVIQDELAGLEALAQELHLAADPPAPKGPALGECPACHKMVRWVPLQAAACCEGCETCRPWREWKSILGVHGLVTASVAVLVLAGEGRVLTPQAVWKWGQRGKITPHQVDGRTLYDPEEVLEAAAKDRRRHAVV